MTGLQVAGDLGSVLAKFDDKVAAALRRGLALRGFVDSLIVKVLKSWLHWCYGGFFLGRSHLVPRMDNWRMTQIQADTTRTSIKERRTTIIKEIQK